MSQPQQSPDEESGIEQQPAPDDDTSTSDVPKSDEEGASVRNEEQKKDDLSEAESAAKE